MTIAKAVFAVLLLIALVAGVVAGVVIFNSTSDTPSARSTTTTSPGTSASASTIPPSSSSTSSVPSASNVAPTQDPYGCGANAIGCAQVCLTLSDFVCENGYFLAYASSIGGWKIPPDRSFYVSEWLSSPRNGDDMTFRYVAVTKGRTTVQFPFKTLSAGTHIYTDATTWVLHSRKQWLRGTYDLEVVVNGAALSSGSKDYLRLVIG